MSDMGKLLYDFVFYSIVSFVFIMVILTVFNLFGWLDDIFKDYRPRRGCSIIILASLLGGVGKSLEYYFGLTTFIDKIGHYSGWLILIGLLILNIYIKIHDK